MDFIFLGFGTVLIAEKRTDHCYLPPENWIFIISFSVKTHSTEYGMIGLLWPAC